MKQFTGISDPYEAPGDAAVAIDTSRMMPEEAAREVLHYLDREGYIGASDVSYQEEPAARAAAAAHAEQLDLLKNGAFPTGGMS